MRFSAVFAITAAFVVAPAALAAPARLNSFEDFSALQARAEGQWTKAIGNTNVGLMAANAAVNIASTIKKLIGKDEYVFRPMFSRHTETDMTVILQAFAV